MKKFKKGFTLIELIVVIAIIAILAAIALPRLSKYLQDANEAKAEANARNAYAAAAAFNSTTKNVITFTDNKHVFTASELQPYLDSNATIVETDPPAKSSEIRVTLYNSLNTSLPSVSNGTLKTGVDVYIVEVFDGSKVVLYGY